MVLNLPEDQLRLDVQSVSDEPLRTEPGAVRHVGHQLRVERSGQVRSEPLGSEPGAVRHVDHQLRSTAQVRSEDCPTTKTQHWTLWPSVRRPCGRLIRDHMTVRCK